MAINLEILRWFFDREYALIPLMSGKNGKRPLHKNWTAREYSSIEIQSHPGNVGCRMGERDLIIDVDMRSGGLESLNALRQTYPEIGPEKYPAVLTGGGGYHYYSRLSEAQVHRWGTKYREVLDDYPGIEFKGLGRQVVIPGSIHPDSGDEYEFDDFSNLSSNPAPPPPDALLSALLLTPGAHALDAETVAPWSPEQLRAALAVLPVEEFDSNASWFPLMCAAYHATAGTGVDEFIAWSTSDPRYSRDGAAIRARWASLQSPSPTRRTAGTLIHEISKRGLEIPGGLGGQISAETEFKGVPLPETRARPTLAEVRGLIDVIDPSADNKEIKPIIDDICYLDPLDRNDAIEALARQSGRPKTVLDATLKRVIQARQPVSGARPIKVADPGDEVSALALSKLYNDGLNIVSQAGQFWTYSGTHWIPTDADVVGQQIMSVVREWLTANPKIKKPVAALTDEAVKTVRREAATKEDLLRLSVEPYPVINTLSGEIWIDEQSGEHEFRDHNPKSYLTTCLDTTYKSGAGCPLFDETLSDIFEPLDRPGRVIQHIWEMIGYTIQPRKNIPHWWLFHGGGANGKTVVLKVLSALLGSAALHTSLGAFGNGNNHATADLVGKLALIDEDVEIGTKLPGELLKKVTENKKMLANPKMLRPYPFVACTSVIMAANNYPRTADISAGIRRRAIVVPFRREFLPWEQDTARAERIIETELPGVLNKALSALVDLRRRGRFDQCLDLRTAGHVWLREANPLAAFFSDVCREGPDDETIPVRKLWDEYQYWTQEQGRKKMIRAVFIDGIRSLGYELIQGGDGLPSRFRGVKLKPLHEREAF